MEKEAKFLSKPEQGGKESVPAKTPYEEVSQAIEILSERIKQQKLEKEETGKLCNMVHDNLRDMKLDFFEQIPLAMKLAKLGDFYHESAARKSISLYPSLQTLTPERAQERAEIDQLIKFLAQEGDSMLSAGIIFDIYKKQRPINNLDPEKAIMLLEATQREFIKGGFHEALYLKDFFEKYELQFKNIAISSEEFAVFYEGMKRFLSSSLVEQSMGLRIQNEITFRHNFPFGDERELAIEWLKNILKKYQLPAGEILEAWFSHQSSAPKVSENIVLISELETKQPGIAKFLYQHFGIRNFERYSERVLVGLFEEYENKDKPYGVLINPTNDWNGAFSAKSEQWGNLFDQLQKRGYTLRIVEARGRLELAKHLVRLNRHYGSAEKISFAIIGGHGTKDSIQFGGVADINTLHTSDLVGTGARKVSRFFKENPTIILVSCSTGADRGIGEKLSKVMKAKVIAPNKPSNINKVEIKKGIRGLEFDVEFTEKETKRVFASGRKRRPKQFLFF